MLDAKNLSKSYGRLRALDALTVTLRQGQAVALIGPNGAGKTTFIKCVLGLVRPDAGELTLDGASLLGDPALRRRIGYMPQIGRFPDHLRVGQLFELMREIRRGTHDRTDEDLIKSFQIDRIAHQTARTLSGGTRQKVSACLAFLFDPDVLVLDEPTAGLDPVSVEILKEKVRAEIARGKLILLTSHILSDLDEIATDVLYLIDGKAQFYRPIGELKSASGETRLGRIVAELMRASANAARATETGSQEETAP
ncbi:MAG: ABC transporter ATP-binding protein [Verrucomicrobia bacterium]|nr:ABC transporter ATP-binding protein [Verrucomicrobiota bacterium]